jgi:hypothetical protein
VAGGQGSAAFFSLGSTTGHDIAAMLAIIDGFSHATGMRILVGAGAL